MNREYTSAAAKPAAACRTAMLRGVLLVLALGLIVLGVLNGGARDVLAKAVRICSECIGLG